jgi:hypothetical protein
VSLTSMLDDTKGPLRAWWDRELPVVKWFTAAGAWKAPLAAPPSETTRSGGDPGLVGTATDYRVRWLWPHGPADDLVGVGLGAYKAFAPLRADELVAEVDEVAGPMAGSTSWDDAQTDERLTRLALVIGRLEASWRSKYPIAPEKAGIHTDMTLEEMMTAQRADLVAGTQSIMSAGRTHLQPLLLTEPVILNPVFSQSLLVGGADADFVAGGCLVELKTTARPSMAANELRQLVTYALLDDTDEHHIREVALFFIRRPQYLTWNLDALLAAAGASKPRAELSASLIETLDGVLPGMR